jgi:hypothetical protein
MCEVTTKYIPSDLEQAWLANAGKWEQDFCNNMAAHASAVNTWVDTLQKLTSLQPQHLTADKGPAQVRKLSYFQHDGTTITLQMHCLFKTSRGCYDGACLQGSDPEGLLQLTGCQRKVQGLYAVAPLSCGQPLSCGM